MPLALCIGQAVLLLQPVLDVRLDLCRRGAAGRGPLLGWLSFGRLGARVSVSVLVLPRLLLGAILELRCSCVLGRSGYGSHGAWACGGWVVWLLLNGCGVWVGGVAHYLSRCGWPTSDLTFHTHTSLHRFSTFTSKTYIIVTMVLGTLRLDNDEGRVASPGLPGLSGTYPYTLPVGSPPPASPPPTLHMGPYATVTPALSLYLMASASAGCGHQGFTPAGVVGARPLPSAVDGTAHVERIGSRSLELDTLHLADSMYLMVEMMFYIGNCCYFNRSARTVEAMMA